MSMQSDDPLEGHLCCAAASMNQSKPVASSQGMDKVLGISCERPTDSEMRRHLENNP